MLAARWLRKNRLIVLGAFVVALGAAIAYAALSGDGRPEGTGSGIAAEETSGTAGSGDATRAAEPAAKTPAAPGPGGPGRDASEGETPERRPAELADDGSKLTTVTVAPEKTIAYIPAPEKGTIHAYSITFQPYGWRPGSPEKPCLVARVVRADPLTDGSGLRDLSGVNALLWVSPDDADLIGTGGVYSGRLEVRPRDERRGSLTLVEVRQENGPSERQ